MIAWKSGKRGEDAENLFLPNTTNQNIEFIGVGRIGNGKEI